MGGRASRSAISRLAVGLRAPSPSASRLAPVAWALGWLGVVGLAALGGLVFVSSDQWPPPLDPALRPVYLVGALGVASLIGWGAVQEGEARVRRVLGPLAGGVLFAVLPLVCAAFGWLEERAIVDAGSGATAEVARAAAVWVPAGVLALSLLAFLAFRARPRGRVHWLRGVSLILLLVPYAVLVSQAVFGGTVPWLAPALDETGELVASLGSGAIAIHLAAAYFLSGDALEG